MAIRDWLRADVRAVLDRDPATGGALEAVLTSPGLWARWSHRVAHWLWTREHRLAARLLSTVARLVTGIEIHPAAEVGEGVVIDHGQGLVVGATATIGDDVLLYHGVTLGAKAARDGQRHPTLGDGVTVGAGATVLGPVEVGDGVTIGAGAVVVDDVTAGETVVGVPAEPIDRDGDEAERPHDGLARDATADAEEPTSERDGSTELADSCPVDDCEGPLVH